MNNSNFVSKLNLMPCKQEMDQLVEICRILSMAPFYQKLGPGGVLAIYLTAREMNLPVMFCLNGGLHNVEGKVVLSSQLINMMLVNAGWEIEFIVMTDEICHLRFHFPDRKRYEDFIYTKQDAMKAGYFGIINADGTFRKKPKDNWIYHTLDMLFARCIVSGGRKFAPNVLGNCYAVGELDIDETISPIAPKSANNFVKPSSNLLTNSTTCEDDDKTITYAKAESWNEFCEKHAISEGTEAFLYLQQICDNSKKKDFTLTVNRAIAAEETFLEMFEKWKSKKEKKAVIDSNEILG